MPRRARLAQAFALLGRAVDRVALGWLVLALVIVTFGGLCASLAPLALKAVVDRLSRLSEPGAETLAPALAVYVGALLLQRLCEQVQALAYASGEQRLIRRLNNQAFAHLMALPLSFHLDGKSGGLTQALAEGITGSRLILTHLALSVTPVVVQVAAAGLVLGAVFGGAMGLTLLAALSAYVAVFVWGLARVHRATRGLSEAQVEVGGATADGLMNIEAVKAYGAEPRLVRRHDALLAASERRWQSFLHRRLENGVAVVGVFGLAMATVLALAGRSVSEGTMSVGAFVMVNAYLLQLVRPLEALGFAVRDIGQGVAYLDRLLETLAQPTEPSLPAGQTQHAPAQQAGPAELVFDAVSFSFGARLILDEVSFRAAPGARIAIVGPSGAGKSSLLRLALRLFDPAGGQIRLDGRSLADIPLQELRRQIALVSQDTILLNDTIAENIGLAREDADRQAILAAARAARLMALLDRLPDGLDTRVGERGLKLSGGEKQRVAIARAALKGARLVIFDEATAALDPETERAVWDAMAGLSRQATSLIVTHRLSALTAVDEILVLDQGRIVERGDHATLVAARGLYSRLWRAQDAADTVKEGHRQDGIGPLAEACPS